MKEPLGSIAIPVRDFIRTETVMSLLHTDWSWVPFMNSVDQMILQGNLLTLQRNESVQRMRGDWLLFIDDDMVWEPDVIGRLVQTRDEFDLDMVGGLCCRRTPPYNPTLYARDQPTSGKLRFIEDWTDDIVEVDATGMAFIVIHKRVFERIAESPMPSLESRQAGPGPDFFRWQGTLGEDLRFCEDAKKSGSRIWVDTRVKIGHVSERVIYERDYLLEVAQRPADVEQAVRVENDASGLPTLSATRAKERLGW